MPSVFSVTPANAAHAFRHVPLSLYSYTPEEIATYMFPLASTAMACGSVAVLNRPEVINVPVGPYLFTLWPCCKTYRSPLEGPPLESTATAYGSLRPVIDASFVAFFVPELYSYLSTEPSKSATYRSPLDGLVAESSTAIPSLSNGSAPS